MRCLRLLLLLLLLLWMRWMRLSDDVRPGLALDWRRTLLDFGIRLGRRRNGRLVLGLRCVARLFLRGLMFGRGF